MANILSIKDFIPDDYNPGLLMKGIAERARRNRLELNLSQEALAEKAGVSLGSLKRFEHSAEISLKKLILIAVALDATEEFGLLFSKRQYQNLDELLATQSLKIKKRGGRK
jgi:transcriptional regulator with XRE-family HTH domain